MVVGPSQGRGRLSADTCECSRACNPPLGSSGSGGRPGSHGRIALGTCEFGMRYGGGNGGHNRKKRNSN